MEELLHRLVPNLADRWQGATEDEIEQIERIAGRPLPRFYRWFLMRMGHSMGPITYPTLDFSAPKVLSCYAEELFVPHPRFLMIGYESDEIMPLHLLYDFDYPARDDARVTKRHYLGGTVYNQYETFREMIAYGKFWMFRVEKLSQRCFGLFVDEGGDVLAQLNPLMESLGFRNPIPTGRCCALYEGTEAAMVTSSTPGDEPRIHGFHLGGNDARVVRKILGEIKMETSLKVEVKSWEPPIILKNE